jgi:hypothetical protein
MRMKQMQSVIFMEGTHPTNKVQRSIKIAGTLKGNGASQATELLNGEAPSQFFWEAKKEWSSADAYGAVALCS